jgi:hypothetical protein
MNTLEVEFLEDGIYFYGYPYPPASVYPFGKILYEKILEVDPSNREIRTKDREILFIAAKYKESLHAVAEKQKIPIVRRIAIWDLILEPFLDTEFNDKHKEQTFKVLEENGVSRNEVENLRSLLKTCMYKYNIESGLWDWCSLGLTDVLDMRLGKLAGFWCRLSKRKYREFYFQAMEIAFRANSF